MKTIFIIFISIFLTANGLLAQHTHFINSGTIEFEKSVNAYAIIKKMYGNNMVGFSQQIFDQYQKTQPQFKKLKSILTFGDNKTLFTPIIPEVNANTTNNFFGDLPMTSQRNTIYTDFATNSAISQKNIYEETFVVKDSLRRIKWKITDETQEIAGYTCRRANGLILDSVYVVAFYTNDIHIPGGPESFSGLPGMILEVALPHDNVIWRAIKVNEAPVTAIVPPKKGKAVTNKQFMETFKSLTKNYQPGKNFDMMKLDYLL